MHQSGVFFLVIAPFNLPTFCCIWVTGIAKISRISLVAKKGVADFFASSLKLVIRAKKAQRVIHWHDRQVLFGHFGHKSSPQSGTNHDRICGDMTPAGFYPLDPSIDDLQTRCSGILKCL